ncbi:MAG: retropepsin-like aspartic protease [Sphingomonas fennica]
MPFILGSLEHLQPLIEVSVGRADGAERRMGRALIDTGATRTCVSRRFVDELALEPRGRMLIQAARGYAARQMAYAFTLGLACRPNEAAEQDTFYVFDQEFAAPFIEDNDSCDVLIGMDLISTGRLTIDRLTFRFDF